MMITKMALCASMLMLADAQASERQPPQRTTPLITGTLWNVPYDAAMNRERLERIIQSQCKVGFNRLWINNTPQLLAAARRNEAAGKPCDPMEMIFQIADQKQLRVIVDLPQGGWYGKAKAEDVIGAVNSHIRDFHARYGKHPSLCGWYLNYEINPISPDDAEQSAWWRKVWRAEVETCHQTRPGSIVTISPFFLLDDKRRRGFVHLTPSQYAAWWGETLKQTGIDVLMLQDSGEHLGFFTLQQREPYWAAVAEACAAVHAKFWLNVESAEIDVADWEQANSTESQKAKVYRFTPIDKLSQKLELAARYAEEIVNWGYFPYMASANGGEETDQQRAAYCAYQTYHESKTAGEAKEEVDGVKLRAIEANIVSCTNEERVRYGLPPLQVDKELMETAREHASWMTRNRSMVHTRRSVAENIAMGQPHSSDVVRCWMNSSGHRANILNPGHCRIGVAAFRTESGTIFWCQQFRR